MDLLNPPRLDKASIRKFFDNAAKSYDDVAIFQEEVSKRLVERLAYMRHRPESVVDLGCGTGRALRGLQKAYPRARLYAVDLASRMLKQAGSQYRLWSKKRLVAADMERLPFASDSFDLVFSSLALPWCNDLNKVLAEMARVARPGGLLLFSSLGPGTLRELAESWQTLDRYPHVHRFIDMHDVGDAMMAAGFAQPVVDAELIRLEYRDFASLLADLKASGSSNADRQRRRGLTTPRQLSALEAAYREYGFEDGRFVASCEVVYGHAWVSEASGDLSRRR